MISKESGTRQYGLHAGVELYFLPAILYICERAECMWWPRPAQQARAVDGKRGRGVRVVRLNRHIRTDKFKAVGDP